MCVESLLIKFIFLFNSLERDRNILFKIKALQQSKE